MVSPRRDGPADASPPQAVAGAGLEGRAGASLVEAVVALLVGLLVLQLGWGTVARFRVARADLEARTDALVALRVGRNVLRRELRQGVSGRDWEATPDSLAVRGFRVTALVCASDSASAELIVLQRGDRAPDPAKDSVLLVTGEGSTAVRALVGVGSASGCAGPGTPARWRLDRGAPTGTVLARAFERGSYSLSGAALRYRRGASGRQPLTPEVWSSSTHWDVSGAHLGVAVVPARAGTPWSGFLAWRIPE